MLSQLEDVEKVQRAYPRTYSIPRRAQRCNLQPGDVVKLVFLRHDVQGGRPHAERMWVTVRSVEVEGYIGVLEGTPFYIQNLQVGDAVAFRPEHVAALHQPHKRLPTGKYALVSPNLLTFEAWPHRLERHTPQEADESGWLLLSAAEAANNTSQRHSFVAYPIEEILQYYPVLDSVLDEPVGTAWVWSQENMEYEAVSHDVHPHAGL